MTYYGTPTWRAYFRVVRKNTLQIAHIAGAVRWAHRVHAVERIAKTSTRCTIERS